MKVIKDVLLYLITVVFFLICYIVTIYFLHINLTSAAEAQGVLFEAEGIGTNTLISRMEEAEQKGFTHFRFQQFTNMRSAKDTQYNRDEYLNRIAYQMIRFEDALQNRTALVRADLHDCPTAFPDTCLQAVRMVLNKCNEYYNCIGIDVNEGNWPKYTKWAQEYVSLVNHIAPYKVCYLEPFRGSPSMVNDLRNIRGNFVVSIHDYCPKEITQQGVLGQSDKAYKYDSTWKSKHEKCLAPVVKFQKETGRQVDVGEFAAVRWSGFPKYCNAPAWYRDSIAYYNKHGWSWVVLSYRGNNVWSIFGACNRNDLQEYPETFVMDEIKNGLKTK